MRFPTGGCRALSVLESLCPRLCQPSSGARTDFCGASLNGSSSSSSSESKDSEHAEEQESKQNADGAEESEETQESGDVSDGEDRWEFEVYFPKEKGWFKGRVLEEEPTENGTESWVVFEDGDKFWLFLGNEKVRPIAA